MIFFMLRVFDNTVYGTDTHTSGCIVKPYTLGALIRINFIYLRPHTDGLIGALWLTHITVDASFKDF
jgi:hypothetical protein